MNKEQEQILLDNQIIQNKALAQILTMLESITKTQLALTEFLSALIRERAYHVFL